MAIDWSSPLRANPALAWALRANGKWTAVRNPDMQYSGVARGSGVEVSMDFLTLVACFGRAVTPSMALAQLSAEAELDPVDFEKSLARLLQLGILQRVDQTLDVVVVSPGGVGTTQLLNFLNRHCYASDVLNQTGIKHLSAPCLSFGGAPAALFVGGDPRLSVLSIFRRGFHPQMSFYLNHVFLLGNRDTVEDYAALGRDLLGINAQAVNWTTPERLVGLPYAVAYVDFRDLWQTLPRVLSFLGLPAELVDDFPAEHPRSSTETTVDPLVWDQLTELYAPTLERFETLRPYTLLHSPSEA